MLKSHGLEPREKKKKSCYQKTTGRKIETLYFNIVIIRMNKKFQ